MKNAAPQTARLRSFWLMFVVEFQNAFSDNVLRWLVTFLIVGMVSSETHRNELVPLVGALFALPFILFSMAGGFFADRFSKRDVTVTIKCAEIGIMSVALLGLWLNIIPLMLAAVFLMSTHSAFFGPSKYGLLPELLPEKKLSWGNGMFGFGTFAAIITGTIFAGNAFGHVRQKTIRFRRNPHRAGADRADSVLCASNACPPPIRKKNSARIFSAILFRR